ncbi:DMT family transporter [Levilactobacillus suantsaii]|uniref:DMT family transporter n=1 Tax=Levilactobacillus suantsaii TaxID=2292255 RepID=UPI001F2DFA6B|nr:DMT family transporter [Levilactobacillus suantsaii]
MFAIVMGVVIGLILPLQTSINSRLRQSVGSPFMASLISFTVGSGFLAVITLLIDHRLFFTPHLFSQQPAWLWLGGVFGVVYLTGNILLFPKLGSVQTVILPMFGQILMGLLIDNFGWFHAKVSPFTTVRGGGALLVLLGVIVTVALSDWLLKRRAALDAAPTTTASASLWLWRLLGIGAGMLGAAQSAINGHLGLVLRSSLDAAFISFFVGALTLLVINLLLRSSRQLTQPTDRPNPWWMWVGGVIGALFVLGNVYLVPILGTGLTVVIVLVGLMGGSLLIDNFGWLESQRNPVTLVQIVGLLIMVGGVALIHLA